MARPPKEAYDLTDAEKRDLIRSENAAFASYVIPAEAGIHTWTPVMTQPTVYILASKRNGTLYVGVTSDPIKRIWEHKQDAVAGFTRKYQVHDLVYFEQHENMSQAIQREKQIKKWNRAWKIELIEKHNPAWRDLWPDII